MSKKNNLRKKQSEDKINKKIFSKNKRIYSFGFLTGEYQ